MKWVIVLLAILLVACSQAPEVSDTQSDVTTQAETQSVVEQKMDIGKAMQVGTPMKCVSTYEGQTSTIYMKGSKMRMDTSPADAHGIYTADTMYTWQGSQGMMMKMEDVKKMAEKQGQAYQQQTQEDVVSKAQETNAECMAFDVPESMFVPPSEVQFQDFGEMMKQLEGMAQGMTQ